MFNRQWSALGSAMTLLALLLLLWSCQTSVGMQIPQDVEILEGYEFDESPEYYSADTNYHEQRHLAKGLSNAVRNKRAIDTYDAMKAGGGVSSASGMTAHEGDTQTVEGAAIEVREVQELNDSPARPPPLPRAEKQVMDPDYDYYAQRRIPSNTWPDGRSSAIEADTMAEASSSSGAYGSARGRQARVNFITQPKAKDAIQAQELSEPPTLLTKIAPSPMKVSGGGGGSGYDGGYGVLPPSPVASPFYNYNYDVYPSRSYDPYLRRYDRYDEQYARYDPYNYEDHFIYRRHYDPYDSYSPRMPQYPEPYYNYPDRRYDLPEPRAGGDYVPLYSNDLYDKAPYPASVASAASVKYPIGTATPVGDYGRQHRRIVYYAHLPEIVRTPYDYAGRYDHERFDGLLTPVKSYSGAYKYDKPNVAMTGGGGTATHRPTEDPYDYMKRDKKLNATPKPGKPGVSSVGRQ